MKFLKKYLILNMDSEKELAAAAVVYILEKKKKRKKRKKRSTWVKPSLTRRDTLGFYNTLQLTTLCNTLQRPINTFLPSKCK